MQKIAFLTEEITKNGGIARVVCMWANYLSNSNIDVSIIATHVKPSYYSLHHNIKVSCLKTFYWPPIISLPLNIISVFRSLILLKRKGINTLVVDRSVHIEPLYILKILGLTYNFKLIYFVHAGTSEIRTFYKNRFLTKHRPFLLNKTFNKVIFLYKDEEQYEINREKIIFISNPLPFKHVDFIDYSKKENIVLNVGRMTREKGIFELVDAWGMYEEKGNWRLWFVGNGPDKEKLIQYCNDKKISGVDFFDGTPDVEKFYERASIFVSASWADGFGLTTIEAMSRGCASISTKTLGGKYLIQNNINGLLVEVKSISMISNAINELIQDQQKRTQLGEAGFRYSKIYDIKKIGEQWNEILNISEFKKSDRG